MALHERCRSVAGTGRSLPERGDRHGRLFSIGPLTLLRLRQQGSAPGVPAVSTKIQLEGILLPLVHSHEHSRLRQALIDAAVQTVDGIHGATAVL